MEKTELLRLKCKLELDVSDLERSLAHANEANEEAQSNMKRYMTQIAEMRTVIAEEQSCREKFQNDLFSVEKKLAKAMSEKEDAIIKQLQMERLKKQVDADLNEARSQQEQLSKQTADLSATKKKLEVEILLMKVYVEVIWFTTECSSETRKLSINVEANL
ncbi:unnamed protein product [Toxocara canis]|uniref:Myosin_tail_1 domain-containing protein n=1 Tax=Toxocara canis TaxID=6265 RepID=A0A183U629_TOXCA|nr:unnamed protein product [Toxocara canis]